MRKQILILITVVLLSVIAGIFAFEPLWEKVSSFRPWRLGLDLAGGSYLVYQIDLSQVDVQDRDSAVNGIRDVIERRVNLFGVSEPRVYTENIGGENRLVAELAGVRDVDEAIRVIGETPFLDFREVVEVENIEAATTTFGFAATGLDGRYLKSARLGFDQITRQPIIQLEFNTEGADIFAALTERNIGQPLAIFLDDGLIASPTVNEKITGGQAQISGMNLEEARILVERFNAGALPAPITLINQQTVSADLGDDSLQKAILAGIIGTLAIILFMLAYYRFFGIFAAVALLMYIALTLAVFKILPITMTLAGIAGFILSIGMAIDANILVFERTKEELKKGLSKGAAIEEGFRRAWTSIWDSNVATLLTAFILYYFTSSFVKGFALTLFIGVIISMFSAITITRSLLRVFISKND